MTTHLPPTQLFIDGRWRDAADGRQFAVVNPSTEAVIAHVADASVQDALDAVAAASRAAPAFARLPGRTRAEMLRRDYGAHAIAALIDEAVVVYERRNLFRRRY